MWCGHGFFSLVCPITLHRSLQLTGFLVAFNHWEKSHSVFKKESWHIRSPIKSIVLIFPACWTTNVTNRFKYVVYKCLFLHWESLWYTKFCIYNQNCKPPPGGLVCFFFFTTACLLPSCWRWVDNILNQWRAIWKRVVKVLGASALSCWAPWSFFKMFKRQHRIDIFRKWILIWVTC